MDVIVEDPESVPGRLLRRFSDAGVEISLKDLTSDIGITTIGAAADDVRTKDPEIADHRGGNPSGPGDRRRQGADGGCAEQSLPQARPEGEC